MDHSPSISDMSLKLETVTSKWYVLGIHLPKVKKSSLDDIEKDFGQHGHKRCLIETLSLWERNDQPSWEKLAQAVEKLRVFDNLVQSLKALSSSSSDSGSDSGYETRSLKPPGKALTHSSTCRVSKESRYTKANVRKMFGGLVIHVKNSLEGRISISDLSLYLNNAFEVCENIDEADSVPQPNMNKLFQLLTKRAWSWFNFEVLEGIVDEFGLENDCEKLQQYKEAFKAFLLSRKLSSEETEVQLGPTEMTGCTKLSIKIEQAWESAYGDLDQLRERFSEILGIERKNLVLSSVREGCIMMTFMVPKSVAMAKFLGKSCLSHVQKKALADINVVWLACGSFKWLRRSFNHQDSSESDDDGQTQEQERIRKPAKSNSVKWKCHETGVSCRTGGIRLMWKLILCLACIAIFGMGMLRPLLVNINHAEHVNTQLEGDLVHGRGMGTVKESIIVYRTEYVNAKGDHISQRIPNYKVYTTIPSYRLQHICRPESAKNLVELICVYDSTNPPIFEEPFFFASKKLDDHIHIVHSVINESLISKISSDLEGLYNCGIIQSESKKLVIESESTTANNDCAFIEIDKCFVNASKGCFSTDVENVKIMFGPVPTQCTTMLATIKNTSTMKTHHKTVTIIFYRVASLTFFFRDSETQLLMLLQQQELNTINDEKQQQELNTINDEKQQQELNTINDEKPIVKTQAKELFPPSIVIVGNETCAIRHFPAICTSNTTFTTKSFGGLLYSKGEGIIFIMHQSGVAQRADLHQSLQIIIITRRELAIN